MPVTHTDPRQRSNIPAISVVMPMYNSERFVADTMQSIVAQTFSDFEFLVLDDGSTDKSLAIAYSFADRDKRIRVIELPHAGVVTALNEGLRQARASWIARIDADDLASPRRLERQVNVLRDYPDLAAIGTHSYIIGETGKVVGRHSFGPTTLKELSELRQRDAMYLISSTVVFSRDIAMELGGYREDYSPTEDIDLWTRIADEHPIIVIPEPLASYRIHANSTSTRKFAKQMRAARRVRENMNRRRGGIPELSDSEFEALERSFPVQKRLKSYLAVISQHQYRRGAGALAAGNFKGLGHLLASLLIYPPLPIERAIKQNVFRQLVALNQ